MPQGEAVPHDTRLSHCIESLVGIGYRWKLCSSLIQSVPWSMVSAKNLATQDPSAPGSGVGHLAWLPTSHMDFETLR